MEKMNTEDKEEAQSVLMRDHNPVTSFKYDHKIALAWSFFFIKFCNELTFDEVLEKILSMGGDTDTNAAIVCGMFGALKGFKSLNQANVKKLLEFRCESEDD